MTRYPIAYLRRSSADATDPGDASREAQLDAVRELARRDGHNGDLVVKDDWNRSADPALEDRRAGFQSMLAAIERDEVSAIYAYALDRLYRSMRTFVRLTDAAKAHDVKIVTQREGVLGGDGSPMAQAFAEITAVFSGLELRTSKARMASVNKALRARDQYVGRLGYGYRFRLAPDGRLARDEKKATIIEPDPDRPLAPVIAAVREGGSILAGAKLLQARGVPSPDACAPDCAKPHHRRAGPVGATRCPDDCTTQHPHIGGVWSSTTLRRIIEANAPELIPPVGPRGRRQPSHAILAQLLVCQCGHVLTPEGPRGPYHRAAYRCAWGNRIGSAVHGPVWVAESTVLPFVQAEVDAHLALPPDLPTADDRAAQRAALEARLGRATELYLAGDIDRERFDREKATVATELDAIGDVEDYLEVPPFDWSWSPAELNRILRMLLSEVRLGPDMKPMEVVWRLERFRS